MIRYLHRSQIDEERWDRVMAASDFETAYAHSWYLDACANRWGALVLDDYDYIMPVAYGKKLGLRYSYQPRFCQQLGIYSDKEVEADILDQFIRGLKKRFKLGNYSFNEGNLLGEKRGFETTDNANYTLPLKPSHEELIRAYTSNCKRNVKKAAQSELLFSAEISVEELVQLKQQHDQVRQDTEHYKGLIRMFSGLEEAGHVKIYGVRLEGQLCAGAIFACSHKRMHYLLSVSTWQGKDLSGMFLVIDRVIQMHANSHIILDFEGSNISSIARFFSGFGAHPQLYQRVRFNHAVGNLIQKIRDVRAD